jgi:hypothetical protein
MCSVRKKGRKGEVKKGIKVVMNEKTGTEEESQEVRKLKEGRKGETTK